MNNTQKRKYISNIIKEPTLLFMAERTAWAETVKNAPKALFKYRAFDKYSFEMIEKSYAYLAPVAGLDDPFDCLNEAGIETYFDQQKNKLKKRGIDVVLSKAASGSKVGDMTKNEIRKIVNDAMGENGLDAEKVKELSVLHHIVEPNEREVFFAVLLNMERNLAGLFKDAQMNGLAESALFPATKVGVLSLTEKRDNKPMWSLYGKRYSGYCVEYEIPHSKEVLTALYPVIYTKRANNNVIEKLLEFMLAELKRSVSSGRVQGNVGATIELFCTKDSDWSYQAEWRVVGRAGGEYRNLPIKAVYLGYNVRKTNEKRMRALAKKHGFALFKMDPPNGTKRITYTRIF